jgi:hypothetical protein
VALQVEVCCFVLRLTKWSPNDRVRHVVMVDFKRLQSARKLGWNARKFAKNARKYFLAARNMFLAFFANFLTVPSSFRKIA